MATKSIIVIGAGICGVSTAIWLQRSGHQVILMDKGEPGMGASFGNAGLIAQWSIDPVTSPKLWADLPNYLLNPNSPLFLQWAYLPTMLPWLAKFLANATDAKTRRIIRDLAPLLSNAVEQHKMLIKNTGLERWISDSKISYVYKSEKTFKRDAYSWKMKNLAGLEPTIITGPAVHEEEPILGPANQCLAVLDGHGHITNPGQYVKELTNYFVSEGGQFINAEVLDLAKVNGRITKVETNHGAFDCSHAVITAGIWSKELMPKLGLTIPLEAERGYHVLYKNPSQIPRNPMLMAAGKFGVNPMDMGLRCAGTVELGSHNTRPSEAPVRALKRFVKEAFPNLTYDSTEEWLGFRPSTPDSIPLIGELGHSGIYANFGHQHIGLTAGPISGRIISQLIDGDELAIDIAPYAPARYVK